MDKKRVEQILRVLLIPFTSVDFLKQDNDFISEYYSRLFTLKETSWNNVIERQEAERKFKEAEYKIQLYLMEHGELVYNSFDDTMLILDRFYPKGEIYRTLSSNKTDKPDGKIIFSKIYLRQLMQISKSLLTSRNGVLSIRTWNMDEEEDIFSEYGTFNKVEIWNTLCRLMPTDILNILYYFECGITDRRYLQNEYGRISLSDNILDVVLKKGIAENHMHFSVAYNYSGVWINTMNIFAWLGHDLKTIPFKTYFPYGQMLVVAGVLRFGVLDYIINRSKRENITDYAVRNNYFEILEAVYDGELFQISDGIYNKCEIYIEGQYRRFRNNNFFEREKYDVDVLLYTYLQDCAQQNTTSESILLFEWIKCIIQSDDNVLLVCLIQYLRIKNSFFSNIFQNNNIQGLDYFQYFFANASWAKNINNTGSENWVRRFLLRNQMQNPKLKKLEIRISPDFELSATALDLDNEVIRKMAKKSIVKIILLYVEAYKQCCEEKQKNLNISDEELDRQFTENRIAMPTIGIIFHFIKKKPIDDVVADCCWLVDTDMDKPLPIENILNMRKLLNIIGTAIAELRNEIPLLGEYVVGIDAASSENNTEPWVFAPVYQAVRNRHTTKMISYSDEGNSIIPNIGFTYHVGEDFRHILSGLRHIDEVVEHFSYKHGDRLGHAIALGISIEDWVNENEVVAMPLSEKMDNLLWVWGMYMKNRLDFTVDCSFLEKEILDMARKIYGNNIMGITVDVLYRVYCQKFLLHYQQNVFAKIKERVIGKGEGSYKYFCKYNKENTSVAWDEEKILCTYFCPLYKERMEQTVWVKVDKKDIKLFQQLQLMVRYNIEHKGIIAEVNPTSNVAISPIKGILSHYLTGLNNCEEGDRKRNVIVMVNSDDPGIMATDVENELSYMYHKLLNDGVPVEKAVQWMDKIRSNGMDFSFVKSVKKPSVIIKELKIIIENLKKSIVENP